MLGEILFQQSEQNKIFAVKEIAAIIRFWSGLLEVGEIEDEMSLKDLGTDLSERIDYFFLRDRED